MRYFSTQLTLQPVNISKWLIPFLTADYKSNWKQLIRARLSLLVFNFTVVAIFNNANSGNTEVIRQEVRDRISTNCHLGVSWPKPGFWHIKNIQMEAIQLMRPINDVSPHWFDVRQGKVPYQFSPSRFFSFLFKGNSFKCDLKKRPPWKPLDVWGKRLEVNYHYLL